MALPKTLYRCILREVRGLALKGGDARRVFITRKVDPLRWGSGGFIDMPSQVDVLIKNLPNAVSRIMDGWVREDRQRLFAAKIARSQAGPDTSEGTERAEESDGVTLRLPLPHVCVDGFTQDQLNKLIRAVFRHRMGGESQDDGIDDAFAAVRLVSEQTRCALQSSERCTRGLSVRAISTYLANDSKARGKHVFCYRVTLHNQGTDTVKLIGRELKIMDASGNVTQTVPKYSPGVIGQHPTLRPGEAFEYHSGCDIQTRVGKMSGSYQMKIVQSDKESTVGTDFDAIIEPFRLQ